MEQKLNQKNTQTIRPLGIWAVLLVLGAFSPLWGAETGIDFNIRFYDRKVYYLESDPILIQVTLTNKNPAPYRFKLADERAFSVDFDVRTNSNRAMPSADLLIRRRTESQQVYFREISVETGESFSFVEDLRNYAAITQSGSYVVQARIFPELYQTANYAASPLLSTNRLTLSIRPRPLPGPDGVPVELDVETNAVLVRDRIPPDEVVQYLLTARQKSQWEKFFLYLDLETMISRDGNRGREWKAESEEGRRRMLNRYRQDLRGNETDREISLIPLKFEIERTVYDNLTGTVTVLQYFDMETFIQKKRYFWYLERKNGIWVIVDYSVTNLGTEGKE
jgi:hypothetical protein